MPQTLVAPTVDCLFSKLDHVDRALGNTEAATTALVNELNGITVSEIGHQAGGSRELDASMLRADAVCKAAGLPTTNHT